MTRWSLPVRHQPKLHALRVLGVGWTPPCHRQTRGRSTSASPSTSSTTLSWENIFSKIKLEKNISKKMKNICNEKIFLSKKNIWVTHLSQVTSDDAWLQNIRSEAGAGHRHVESSYSRTWPWPQGAVGLLQRQLSIPRHPRLWENIEERWK